MKFKYKRSFAPTFFDPFETASNSDCFTARSTSSWNYRYLGGLKWILVEFLQNVNITILPTHVFLQQTKSHAEFGG